MKHIVNLFLLAINYLLIIFFPLNLYRPDHYNRLTISNLISKQIHIKYLILKLPLRRDQYFSSIVTEACFSFISFIFATMKLSVSSFKLYFHHFIRFFPCFRLNIFHLFQSNMFVR